MRGLSCIHEEDENYSSRLCTQQDYVQEEDELPSEEEAKEAEPVQEVKIPNEHERNGTHRFWEKIKQCQ